MSKTVGINRFEQSSERKVTNKDLRRIELFQELCEYVKPINTVEDDSTLSAMSEQASPINKKFLEQYDQETYSKFMSRHYFSQALRD